MEWWSLYTLCVTHMDGLDQWLISRVCVASKENSTASVYSSGTLGGPNAVYQSTKAIACELR